MQVVLHAHVDACHLSLTYGAIICIMISRTGNKKVKERASQDQSVTTHHPFISIVKNNAITYLPCKQGNVALSFNERKPL